MEAASIPANKPAASQRLRGLISSYGLVAVLLAFPVFYGIQDLKDDGNLVRLGENITAGISNGAIWALVAIGYTLVYGIVELINFAHGEVFMLGSFISASFAATIGLHTGTSAIVLFFGLLVFYARGIRFFYVFLAAFVMVTSLMVSYTRARAEALIGSCKVGFMERPERVVLIILGALFNRWGVMAPVLWVLAVLSTITVIHRISYTYSRTNTAPSPAKAPAGPARSTTPELTSELHPANRA